MKASVIKQIQDAQLLCEVLGVPFKKFDKVMRKYVKPHKGFIDDQLEQLSEEKLNNLHDKLVALLDEQKRKG